MAETDPVTYVKLSSIDGSVIERNAVTPADHVQFKGTGWVRKDSAAGKRVLSPKKSDDVESLPATSVTAHAAAATLDTGSANTTSTKSTTKS